MTNHAITIEFDDDALASNSDERLAMLWHVAQANPAPHGDRAAGDAVESIGREIIRRWLRATPPSLWHHQGRSYYWTHLGRFAKYVNGTWVPRDTNEVAP